MRNHGIFLCPAVFCLILVFQMPTQAQTHARADTPTEEITLYSKDYVRTAGDVAALFIGKIQPQLPANIESLYLRDRGDIERDSSGAELFPRPVSPLESYGVGDLFYDGVLYVGIRMRLDLYRDQMVAASPGHSFYGALLDPGRFGYADLKGYRVIYVPAPLSDFDLPEGYYLRLREGRLDLLKKETFEFDPSQLEFRHRQLKYYIQKDGVYHRVGRRKGPVLRLLRDRRSELDTFIRSKGYDLRNDTEKALVEIVNEYERLTDL